MTREGGIPLREMTIRDILLSHPSTRHLFERYGLAGCGGPGGPSESLELVAAMHRIPLEALLLEIEEAASNSDSEVLPLETIERDIYPGFIKGALWFTLILGAGFGAYNLLAVDYSLGAVPPAHHQAHAITLRQACEMKGKDASAVLARIQASA